MSYKEKPNPKAMRSESASKRRKTQMLLETMGSESASKRRTQKLLETMSIFTSPEIEAALQLIQLSFSSSDCNESDPISCMNKVEEVVQEKHNDVVRKPAAAGVGLSYSSSSTVTSVKDFGTEGAGDASPSRTRKRKFRDVSDIYNNTEPLS